VSACGPLNVSEHTFLAVLKRAFAYADQPLVGLDSQKNEVSPARSQDQRLDSSDFHGTILLTGACFSERMPRRSARPRKIRRSNLAQMKEGGNGRLLPLRPWGMKAPQKEVNRKSANNSPWTAFRGVPAGEACL
jgi:hypothetical protein